MADKVSFTFNPFRDVKVPENKRAKAKSAVKDFVLEQVLSFVGSSRSPVKKGRWTKSLTKAYAKKAGKSVANLEKTGKMLNALKVVRTEEGKLEIKIEGSQAGKAEGNNRGTYGGKRTGRRREFIPKSNQTWKKQIWDGIKTINRRFKEGEE